MGGRGSGGGGGGGRYNGGRLDPNDIVSTRDLITERGAKQAEVDSVLQAFQNVFEGYGSSVEEIQLAKLKGKGNSTLAYFDGNNIAFNERYFDTATMDAAYDESIQSGFHPGRGNKSGLEATAAHELGHQLTNDAAVKMGFSGMIGLDRAADKIVSEARAITKDKGVVVMARKISEYATASNAEAVAEAYADVYCNGNKAKKESRAVVQVLEKYLKS